MGNQSMVMTKKERLAGELEKHDEMQGLMVELRILNRIGSNDSSLVRDMIKKKGDKLTMLWGGGDKYKYGLTGEEEPK